jgi:hypothetical protein
VGDDAETQPELFTGADNNTSSGIGVDALLLSLFRKKIEAPNSSFPLLLSSYYFLRASLGRQVKPS